MRTSILVAAVLCLSLSACGKLETIATAVTTSAVPAKTIYVAENAFNVAKKAADGYIVYCTPNPAPVGCNDDVIVNDIIPAVNKGTDARKMLDAFLKAHPGELGDKASTTLVSAKDTITDLLAKNDKR